MEQSDKCNIVQETINHSGLSAEGAVKSELKLDAER